MLLIIQCSPSLNECKLIGEKLSQIHVASKNFYYVRKNTLGNTEWPRMTKHILNYNLQRFNINPKEIEDYSNLIFRNWPTNLSKGIIHGDMFPDNVFFKNGKISAIIDFYFSCVDFYIYDLAIILNSWCFNKLNVFFKNLENLSTRGVI